jgi:hypothetical protein
MASSSDRTGILMFMSEAAAELIAKALVALDAPNNEPLRWLMGNALREQTGWPSSPHFLLTALSRPRTGTLVGWNAWIAEFRSLLINPELAPPKATDDLRSGGAEVEDKLRAVAAEVQATIELKNRGFSDFSVVAPSDTPKPDFEAMFEGKKARIEVKNLREPMDHLQAVATDEWARRRKLSPERYGFNARLRHSHRGTLSDAAESRLRNILAQFPDKKGPSIETLDGDIDIRLERITDLGDTPEAWMHRQILQPDDTGRIIVVSTIREKHLESNITELQALFLKASRTIVSAQPKFFSKRTRAPDEQLNVIALRWESPDIFFDPQMLKWAENRIEKLYEDFGLQLKVVIFAGNGPEMPWELLNRYR